MVFENLKNELEHLSLKHKLVAKNYISIKEHNEEISKIKSIHEETKQKVIEKYELTANHNSERYMTLLSNLNLKPCFTKSDESINCSNLNSIQLNFTLNNSEMRPVILALI